MTYPPSGPQHRYPDPDPVPDYPHPNTETQAIPHPARPHQGALPQAMPPQESPLQGLLQGPPPAPAAPPPGHPLQQGYPPAGYGPPRPPMPPIMIAVWTLATISIAGVALGLSIKEHDVNAWRSVHAWGAVAILGAVLTAAPAFGAAAHLSPARSWQVGVAGGATLAFFWILFVLPSVGSNTTLLATVGVLAGVMAAWIAPGQPPATTSDAPTW